MNDTLTTAQRAKAAHRHAGEDWRRRISNHVAWGLLVYTGLHIFLTMTQLKSSSGSILPYFALIVLVVAVIPAARAFEMRWEGLTSGALPDGALEPQFRREVGILWLIAIGLPVFLTFGFQSLAALF